MNHISDVWFISNLDITIRIVLAAVLGGLIGLEREWKNHAAGFRTHMLVCIGSCTIMLLSIYGFSQFVGQINVRMDPARLAAQVISGIGFLGAGAILRHGLTISGLTTAASIWVVAAIGLSVGAGFYYSAGLSTVLVVISLFLLNKWEKSLFRFRRSFELVVIMEDRPDEVRLLLSILEREKVNVVNVNVYAQDNQEAELESIDIESLEIRLMIKLRNEQQWIRALDKMTSIPSLHSIESDFNLSTGLQKAYT